jgi:ribonuclease T2
VTIDCREDGERRLVVELKLNLAGEITSSSRLADLLAAAPPVEPGCSSGLIDPVGLGG